MSSGADPKARQGGVRILPLGGLGEIGMNCMAIVSGSDAVVIDCGVSFADRAFGADVIHPNFSELERYDVHGVVLTHGHEDHIGALPYLLSRFDVPIFGPRYALGLLDERSREHELLAYAELNETTPRKRFKLGPFTIESIRVAHSTADATALAIETPSGLVVHTGDFKFDDDDAQDARGRPVEFDEERFAELGKAGISLLLSDSTNADREGSAGSERDAAEKLHAIIDGARGAVVVTMFASNVARLSALGRIAKATHRKLVMIGRSVDTHARVARRCGLLDFPSDLIFSEPRARELPKTSILAIATGSQGEPNAGLAKLARDEVEGLSLGDGDTVIFSSRVIPGHELDVQDIVNKLLRRGIDVRWTPTDPGVHVSGHACREEQRRMIDLTMPRAFVPIHGSLHHLHAHAKLARESGVDHALVIENGQSVRLSEQGVIAKDAVFPVGKVFTWDKREVPQGVLGERRVLAQDGVASVLLTLDSRLELAAPPEVSVRGVMTEPMLVRCIKEVRDDIREALSELGPPRTKERICESARLTTRRVLAKHAGRKPMVLVSISAPKDTR